MSGIASVPAFISEQQKIPPPPSFGEKSESRAIEGLSSSAIGVIGTAPDAVAEALPLNTPVLTTGNASAMAKLEATGTLPTAIAGILAQTGANIVVVRIAEGVAHDEVSADEAAVAFATSCANQRVYAIYPQVINTKNETVAASPYVAGVIARTDKEVGFWCSPSNKIVNGIVGLSKSVDFALGDSACKASYLNENGIATIVNQDGYRLWGNRTTSDEAAYKFLCVRRTADIISDSILKAHLWAVDRNIVKNYLTDVTESVNAFLSSLKSQGAILQGKCYANKELNTAANIAEGKVFFDFSFTPAYPAEQVTFRAYLDNLDLDSVLFENVA
jgi:phage tail sheath protein FI